MSPLVLLCLLGCVVLASTAVYQRQHPAGDIPGSELSQLTTETKLRCGVHCQRAGAACVGFHHEASVCRLFSALYPGLAGTFVRQPRSAPAGYSACGHTAYRIYPPMSRDAVKAACAKAGGRMAVPVTAAERHHVQQLMAEANAVPGFNPPDLSKPNVAYLGVLVYGPAPNYTITDLEGNTLALPADVWNEGKPNDGRRLSYATLKGGKYTDWYILSKLMNVCEVGLFE